MASLVKKPRDTRSAKRRLQDMAQTSKRTVRPDDDSPQGKARIAEWRRKPNALDVEGVDDAKTGERLLKGGMAAGGQGVRLTAAETRRQALIADKREKRGKGYGDPTFAFSISDPREKYWFQWQVADIDDFIPSHTSNFAVNPRYTSELQPRERDREGAKAIVQRNASRLAPEILLYDTGALDVGPPIVGPDQMVESGNGRFIAIQTAIDQYPHHYNAYAERLRAEADAYGLDDKDFEGVKHPVLVRERLTPVADRVRFVTEANNTPTQDMSTIEKARGDAGRVTVNDIAQFQAVAGKNLDEALNAASNRPLVDSIMRHVPAEESSALWSKDGRRLTGPGLDRVKAALVYRVYGGGAEGDKLASAIFDSKDASALALLEGMQNSLPAVARLKAEVDKGEKDGALDITDDVVSALSAVMDAKRAGQSLDDELKERALGNPFTREIDPERPPLTPAQEALARAAETYRRTPAKWRDFLNEYAEWGLQLPPKPPPDQGGFGGFSGFGEVAERDWNLERTQALQRAFEATKGARVTTETAFDVTELAPAAPPAPPAPVEAPTVAPSAPSAPPVNVVVNASPAAPSAPPTMVDTSGLTPVAPPPSLGDSPTQKQKDRATQLANQLGYGDWTGAVASRYGMSRSAAGRRATKEMLSDLIGKLTDEAEKKAEEAKPVIAADTPPKIEERSAPFSKTKASRSQLTLLNNLADEAGYDDWESAISDIYNMSRSAAGRRMNKVLASDAIDALQEHIDNVLEYEEAREAAATVAPSPSEPEPAAEPAPAVAPEPVVAEKSVAEQVDDEIARRRNIVGRAPTAPEPLTKKEIDKLKVADVERDYLALKRFIEESAFEAAYRRGRERGFPEKAAREGAEAESSAAWSEYSNRESRAVVRSRKRGDAAKRADSRRAVLRMYHLDEPLEALGEPAPARDVIAEAEAANARRAAELEAKRAAARVVESPPVAATPSGFGEEFDETYTPILGSGNVSVLALTEADVKRMKVHDLPRATGAAKNVLYGRTEKALYARALADGFTEAEADKLAQVVTQFGYSDAYNAAYRKAYDSAKVKSHRAKDNVADRAALMWFVSGEAAKVPPYKEEDYQEAVRQAREIKARGGTFARSAGTTVRYSVI